MCPKRRSPPDVYRDVEPSQPAEPAVAPGSYQDVGTMYAAFYGTAQRSADHDEHDEYSLFYLRSTALGWLDQNGRGLWHMNDAGDRLPHEPASLIAWFQVGLSWIGPRELGHPVQPFIQCAWDTQDELHRSEVDTVRARVPVRQLSPDDTYFLPDTAWPSRTESTTEPMIGIGTHTELDRGFRDIVTRLTEPALDITGCRPARDDASGSCIPPVLDGAPESRLELRATIDSWSSDSVGWLCAVLDDAAASSGARQSVAVTLSRDPRR